MTDQSIEVEQVSFAAPTGHPRTFKDTCKILSEDLTRYAGRPSLGQGFKHFIVTPGFKFITLMRWTGYFKRNKLTKPILYPFFKVWLLSCQYKFGIAISEDSVIGGGFFINRFGGIYFHKDVVIGRNVNITHGVVLGQVNGGSKMGSPTIGDRVFLGSGAKIMGRIHIGHDSAIGANALVASDVAPSSVMAAPQANMISQRGSGKYINNQA